MKGRALQAGALGIAAAAFVAATPAAAASVEASSTTLLAGRPDVRYGEVHTAVPLTELVGLNATGADLFGFDELKLRVSGWGRLDATENKTLAGDLEMAYVQGRLLDRRVAVTLGRQQVTGGAARFTTVDGAAVDGRLWKGLGATVFGGAPVTPRFTLSRADWLYGGRVYYRRSLATEVGVSYEQALDHGLTARQDAGLDARVGIMSGLYLEGYGLWSLAERRLAEVDVGPTFAPFRRLQVRARYRRTAPDLFLPRNSIFSVFAETKRDEAGADASFQLTRYLSLFADYRQLWTADGAGEDLSARATFRSDPSSRTYVGAEARVLRVPVNGYVQGRLFGTYRPLEKLTVALDLDGYRFTQEINGARASFTAALTGAYTLWPGWLAALSCTGGTTVLLESRFEVLAKLVYNLPTTTTGRTP